MSSEPNTLTQRVSAPAVKEFVCMVWVTFCSPDWIILAAVWMFESIVGNPIRSVSKYYIELQIKYIGMNLY